MTTRRHDVRAWELKESWQGVRHDERAWRHSSAAFNRSTQMRHSKCGHRMRYATACRQEERAWEALWVRASDVAAEGLLLSKHMLLEHLPDRTLAVLSRALTRAAGDGAPHSDLQCAGGGGAAAPHRSVEGEADSGAMPCCAREHPAAGGTAPRGSPTGSPGATEPLLPAAVAAARAETRGRAETSRGEQAGARDVRSRRGNGSERDPLLPP